MRAGRNGAPPGWLRFFNADFGTQISWLIPAAVIAARPRCGCGGGDPAPTRTRAALLLWGGWLVVTVVVISLAKGIIHPYYSVAAAPAIGAMVGIGGSSLWEQREHLVARIVLAAALAATAVWSFVLLDRAPHGCRGYARWCWRWGSSPPCFSSCSPACAARRPSRSDR